MDNELKVRLLVLSSGERYSVLVDRSSGLPVIAPNLYLTSQVRNADLSHASLAAAAGCLVVLYRFCHQREIDLEARFRAKKFFDLAELDALRDFCRENFASSQSANSNARGTPKFMYCNPYVEKATQHRRLTLAASYFAWLARWQMNHLEEEPMELSGMIKALQARRPSAGGRNAGLIDRSLSEQELDCLLSTIEVDNFSNPFHTSVRARNRLIILIELSLGIRAGEALNIRIEDIDFSSNTLSIIRRADQKDDTRKQQPLVKTLDRKLPVSNWLTSELHNYIVHIRRKVPGSKRNPYLFITYKAGPTQGQALSIASYKKMWSKLQRADVLLSNVTGHRLRHSWNYNFSVLVDNGTYELNEAEEEAARSVLMGWRIGSGSAKNYNRRFIVRKANEASIELQRKIFERGANND